MSQAEVTRATERQGAERWLVLLGALQVQIVLGVVYGFSALIEPLQVSFPGWTNRDVQIANTLALLCFALTTVPAGWLQDRRGPRLPALLGAGFLLLAFLTASTVSLEAHRLRWWISYGVLYGVGIGLAYVCPIAALVKWFPKHKGLITGIAVAGFGGGAAIFIPTVGPFLAGHTLAQFFRLHALICGLLVACGALLLKNPPPSATAATAARHEGPTRDLDWREMVRRGSFWRLWAMFVGSATAGLMTIAVARAAVADTPGILPAAAATAAAVLSLMNALGRVFWGAMSDRLTRDRAMIIMFGLQALAMFALAPGLTLGPAAAIGLMGLIGLNFGGNFALFPAATADAFGTRHLGVNYGWVYTSYGVAGVLGPQIAAWFKDVHQTYTPAFVIAGVLVACASAIAAIGVRPLHAPGQGPQTRAV